MIFYSVYNINSTFKMINVSQFDLRQTRKTTFQTTQNDGLDFVARTFDVKICGHH